MRTTRPRLVLVSCAIGLLTTLAAPPAGAGGAEIPASLTDQAFWKLSADASEPGGYFRSQDITNLTSNELWFQHVIPDLVKRTKPGRVYLGVGPEQNFTYMAAIGPKMAIIFDIRRGNLDLQLMYKAIFELSKDRADFVAMLFSRPRPAGLSRNPPPPSFQRVCSSRPRRRSSIRSAAIEDRLTRTHGLPLPASDLDGIDVRVSRLLLSGFAVRPVADVRRIDDRHRRRRRQSQLPGHEADFRN